MCRRCGCADFIGQGHEALGGVIRAVNQVHEDNQRHSAELRRRHGPVGG
ncbi:MAG: hypothetical protein HY675_16450 [Chloroflexi bacterium]|nr:hypothetical protein [Chloroflexota bacterium]